MFGNKIGKIVSDNVNVTQVKTAAKEGIKEGVELAVETGVDAVTTGAKSVVHGIMFTVSIWVVGIVTVIAGVIYGLGAVFS